jgi:hypothetical protein
MAISFEEALIDVWRQTPVENAKAVLLGTEHYSADSKAPIAAGGFHVRRERDSRA